jgi:hypothetical protein
MALTHAEIAHLLGRSRSLVTKYVQRGMPIGTADEARAWFDANVAPRADYKRAAPGNIGGALRPSHVQTSADDAPRDLRPLAELWLANRDPATLERIRDEVMASIQSDRELFLPPEIFDALVGDRL